MTRSKWAGASSLLACSLLLCAASSAQVRAFLRGGFFLLSLSSLIHQIPARRREEPSSSAVGVGSPRVDSERRGLFCLWLSFGFSAADRSVRQAHADAT